MAEVDRQLILENVGPVQAVLDAHDGVVNVIDTTDGIIMIGLEEAEHTLLDRAKRIGQAALPIDLASIPKL